MFGYIASVGTSAVRWRAQRLSPWSGMLAVAVVVLGTLGLGAGTAVAATGGGATRPSTALTQPGYYELRVQSSGKCLDINRAGDQDGALAQQWTCHDGANQQWRLVPVGGGYYELRVLSSGKCLDINRAGDQDGALAQQWTCHDGANQHWQLIPVGDGHYELRVQSSGKCLDINRAGDQDGALAQQWTYHDGANQHWQLVSGRTAELS